MGKYHLVTFYVKVDQNKSLVKKFIGRKDIGQKNEDEVSLDELTADEKSAYGHSVLYLTIQLTSSVMRNENVFKVVIETRPFFLLAQITLIVS